jgi:hypothetical protein
MSNNPSVFFARITNRTKLDMELKTIQTEFDQYGKIYILSVEDNTETRIIVFNARIAVNDRRIGYARIARKSETDTIFTLSALAMLTEQSGWDGLKEDYVPDWERYSNHFLYMQDGYLQIRKTKLVRLITEDVKKVEENMC